MSATRQLCTFYVADLLIGVDVLAVQEVMRSRPLARVPLAPVEIQGLINLRGQIVTAIDLRRRLNFPPRPETISPMFMIMRTVDGFVAFLVDSVGDVIDVADDTFELPPDTMPAAARALVSGVHKLPKQILHVLAIEQAAELNAA